MNKYHYFINCIDWPFNINLLNDMIDNAIEITWSTIVKHCDIQDIKDLFPCYDYEGKGGLHIKNDYAVSFYRSKLKEKRIYYICHSAIEYIFTEV